MKKSIKINALLNIIRQVCVIIFPMVTFPYISRILGAANYGKVTFSQSIISYFSLLAALGISNYAIREGSAIRDKTSNLNRFFAEILTLNLFSTLVAYLFLLLTVVFVDRLHGYTLLISIFSVTIILTTFGVDWIYTIFEDFAYITVRSILFQLISVLLMFAFVHQEKDYIKYAVILVVSSGGSNILNLIHARKYFRFHLVKIKDTFKHLKAVSILFFNNLMISIYVNSDTTIIGFLRGDYEVGLYSVAAKLYSIVKNVINAIVVVAIPKASFYVNNNEKTKYNNLINKVINCVIVCIFPTVTGLFMESPYIIKLISGEEYIDSYAALRVLSVTMVFSLFAAIFSNLVLLPYKRDAVILKATVSSALTNIILNFIFIYFWGYTGAAVTTALAEFMVAVTCFWQSKKYIKIRVNIKDGISCFIGCIGIVCVCVMSHLLFSYTIVNEFVTIFMAVLIYFVVLLLFNNSVLVENLRELLSRVMPHKK